MYKNTTKPASLNIFYELRKKIPMKLPLRLLAWLLCLVGQHLPHIFANNSYVVHVLMAPKFVHDSNK